MNFKKAMSKTSKFRAIESARNFADRATRGQAIVLGDDNKYWVCSLGVAEWLNRNGYQYA